ncbi:16S rRNA (adenine(1518)-N(6)/adenine(1519)-N(6))-dimethyltransferase, partial [bacterium]|nr:16S rRNA (adenine(1518)-N(6)/adenine(1519)-N(6))-dimethyltransferase [bacterium]MBU1024643.1 16S rRNA (adenine(1518)-N(6)/adenine(1519)-N(6))-dimethyltransferase [bacterium]
MLEGKSLNEFTHSVERKLGIRPKKSLGQNFLISDTIRNKILELIGDGFGTIVEIGGGLGALSIPLAMKGAELIVYEKDDVLQSWLEKELKYHNEKVVVKGDFLEEYPLKELEDREFVVVGNIPYQITSPILERIYNSPVLPAEVVLMVQKEVAQRIDAKPGTRARGRLTV